MSYAKEIDTLNQHIADINNKKLMFLLNSSRRKMKKWKTCYGTPFIV
ncbi:conserved domain protein [Haemophilus pittmaniae HK 85]|uniref:Conserved domain protein n=1 Tax=Haemophilus pittmaniae HK 85 TaxID=1035188 RepID=F9Q5W7_9PAST|nr:conserved domain protein [Haemophilus pittmaniae HK 85]